MYSYTVSHVIGMSLTLPPPPLSFTELPVSDTAGSFLINASSLSSSEDEISAFLFKVETETGTYYVLQVHSKRETIYSVPSDINTSSHIVLRQYITQRWYAFLLVLHLTKWEVTGNCNCFICSPL